MATPNRPQTVPASRKVSAAAPAQESDLVAEILSAEADFERGDFIDITPEQLARAIETGESPWPDESLG